MSLKIQFQVGSVLYKIAKFSKNITTTPSNPLFQHPQLRIWAPNQKTTFSILFVLSNPIQNCITQPGSIKNRKVITFQAKGLDAGLGLHCRNWAQVLPTHPKVTGHQPSNP